MQAVVFGSANIEDYGFCRKYLLSAQVIICCDGGMEHTKKLGILPHYILGDFDSVSKDTLTYYQDLGISCKSYPTQKDETDMAIGISLALELGATDIVIIGGMGNRFDHTLANAHLLLRLLKQGVRGRLVSEHSVVELIDSSLTVYGKQGDLVSLIPLSLKVTGVTLEGFFYPLTDAILAIEDSLVAVSNELLGEEGRISVKEGYLYVICSWE